MKEKRIKEKQEPFIKKHFTTKKTSMMYCTLNFITYYLDIFLNLALFKKVTLNLYRKGNMME